MSKLLQEGNYRVLGKQGTLDIYKRLKGKIFNEYHNLFTLCVCLAYKNKKKMTSKRKVEQLFWSDTFSPHEYAAFSSIIIKEDPNEEYLLLKDGENSLKYLQDYADAGIEILLKSDVMKNYIKNKNDILTLDFGEKDYLQKQIMYYVWSVYQSL